MNKLLTCSSIKRISVEKYDVPLFGLLDAEETEHHKKEIK